MTEQLRQRGWTVDIAGPPGVLAGLDHEVAVPAGLQPLAVPRAIRQLRGLLPRYDIVHAHGLTAGWIAVLARARPIVLTVHNVVLDEAAGRMARPLRLLERALPRRVCHVIAVSPEIAADVDRYAPGVPVTIVGPLGPRPQPRRAGAATRSALGVGDAPLAVCVARLHPQKGLDVLLRAVPALVAAVPGARVAVVGEGPLLAELRRDAARLGVADAVVFGAPVHPADEMAAADVVVIPSRWESGPLVLTEAMLLDRPVVATPVGSVGELITDGDTGWLVPIGDSAALAEALAHALSDREEAARRATAGRGRAEVVADPDRRVSLVVDAYRATLDRR